MAAEKIDALELDITSKATTENIDKLIDALGRLSTALNKVKSKSVSVNVKATGDASAEAAVKADKLSNSFLGQAVKITALIAVYKRLYSTISDAVSNSATYIKSLNMFTVSLGEYADNATKYGETVSDALGIDISGWQKTQGIFQTLITGFGVTGDKAAYMSQNITQLSYDIASFYGISNEEAANKLKSALSGRLEPIRKLGYDLSQSKLVDLAKNPANYGKQTFAVNEQTGAIEQNTIAVDKNTQHKIVNFNQLTQQEKVQLRYIALMTQVTQVQGNYARALNDPANQLNVFKEQLNMTNRALGNIFIPLLNKALPYLSAFAQLAREAFNSLANLFGFELPDMKDRTDISGNTKPYNDVVKATGNAAKNAKKLKDYMLGIDELNVFNPNTGATGGAGSGKGQNSNLKNLLTPGYDFLSKAVENSIKNAKAAISKLFSDLKANPLLLKDIIVWGFESLGDKVGSNFWEALFGMSPDKLAEEAAKNGRTVGEEFAVQFWKAVGGAGSDMWSVILGQTPEQLAQDAQRYGGDVSVAFNVGFVDKLPSLPSDWVKGVPFMEALFGSPDKMAKRAGEAGRSIAEQFILEFGIKCASALSKSKVLTWLFERATGHSLKADIDSMYNAMREGNTDKTVQPETTSVRASFPYVSADAAKALNDMSHKVGYDSARSFAKGQKDATPEVKNATNSVYKAGYTGLTADGTITQKYGYVSADAAKAYYNNLKSKTALSNTKSAGGKLADAGVSGAKTENGTNKGFYKAGEQSGSGYVLGINSNRNILKYKNSSKVVATTTLKALKNFLGIKSPSREAMVLGDYTGEGYAIGIEKSVNYATRAAQDLASTTITALGNASDLSNKTILNGTLADPMAVKANVPTTNNAGYSVGATNEGAMASLASNIYQAVVSGMASANIGNGSGGDIKVIIDGKEVFKAVQTESRKRGVAISNGTFSR